MKTVHGLALGFLVLFVTGFAVADEKIDKDKLIGKWTPLKKQGVVIEFQKDGKMVITGMAEGKEIRMEGKYTLEDARLSVNFKTPDGSDRKENLKLKSLTDEKMITVDEKEKEEELKRVK
jgi:uncharacterized protein (TIGR03066 family)